ncbi:MAG: ATP-binding protein [Lachnospira sp.]
MGRHSIKVKISLLLVAIIVFLVTLLLIINKTFSEKFYVNKKEKALTEAYFTINDLTKQYTDGELSDSGLSDSMEQLTNNNAISALIVSSDWSTVYVSTNEDQRLLERLRISIFNSDILDFMDSENAPEKPSMEEKETRSDKDFNKDFQKDDKNPSKVSINMIGNGAEEKRDIIVSTDDYTLQRVFDSRLNDDYLELYGTLENGDSVMLRTPIQGIKENVEISNKLITYVGIMVLIVGVIVSLIFSTYFTKPIEKLSNIAQRMAVMDFDVKYEGNDKSEIGVLGNSMNYMSTQLEDNISQLKMANLELKRDIDNKEKVEQMRNEFLSSVSHELKTPIALIQGYAEGLKEGVSNDPESMAFYCEVIMDEAAKMNSMVKKILTINELEFGKADMSMERFNINELCQGVVNSNILLANQKNIKITLNNNNGEPIYVWADEYKIEEVLTNYLSNAINHCCNENRIEVTIDRIDSDNVRVTVFNTGNNIPEEDIEHIWDKFYKVDKARTREYGGNGIGLSIVKAIMDSHGKEYGVRNTDNGVEFWFDLDCKL